MRASLHVWFVFVLTLPATLAGQDDEFVEILDWSRLADFPDELGVAAPFAGVSDGVLIVAGGANFPVPLWKDGKRNPDARKVWHNNVHVLLSPDGSWRENDPLPRPLAYGASVSDPASDGSLGVICIGGGDETFHYREVFTIQWVEAYIKHAVLPALPETCAYMGAAIVGDPLYVAGGRETPNSPTAMKSFWALDLAVVRDRSRMDAAWKPLPSWPGPARMLAVAGAQGGSFFLISGVELIRDDADDVKRIYLTDGYRYTPGASGDSEAASGNWTRIADTPAPVAAAPSPAPAFGTSQLLVFGGDDGRLAEQNEQLADEHPGFRRDTLAYHTITDTWAKLGELPAAHVTATVVEWNESLIIPSGEVAPGIRSPAVLSAKPRDPKLGFAAMDYVVVGLYLLVLGMGVYFVKRVWRCRRGRRVSRA